MRDITFGADEPNLSYAIAEGLVALEKQIPIKVGVYTNGGFKHCCPKCGTPAISDHEKYCTECGQKLHWS